MAFVYLHVALPPTWVAGRRGGGTEVQATRLVNGEVAQRDEAADVRAAGRVNGRFRVAVGALLHMRNRGAVGCLKGQSNLATFSFP